MRLLLIRPSASIWLDFKDRGNIFCDTISEAYCNYLVNVTCDKGVKSFKNDLQVTRLLWIDLRVVYKWRHAVLFCLWTYEGRIRRAFQIYKKLGLDFLKLDPKFKMYVIAMQESTLLKKISSKMDKISSNIFTMVASI